MKISLVAYAVMLALNSEQYNRPVVKTPTVGQALVLAELEKEQNNE